MIFYSKTHNAYVSISLRYYNNVYDAIQMEIKIKNTKINIIYQPKNCKANTFFTEIIYKFIQISISIYIQIYRLQNDFLFLHNIHTYTNLSI